MDTSALDLAYRRLLTTAAALDDHSLTESPARDDTDWTLAHIALSDRLLAATARDVLTGAPAVVDNRAAMDDTAIGTLIASTTDAQRIGLVRGAADGLLAVIRTIPGHAAGRPVRLRLVNREGQPVPEQSMPWHRLVELRASTHIPGHTERLAALVAGR
ncbi:hypothetical protein [Streptomyces albus]|uniref:hypothetical protein n=1 Tax=Streptomyces albus TaxID=1888 RepID=UPI0006E3E5DD|nr:hypothetical protein [Streptomyces albus]